MRLHASAAVLTALSVFVIAQPGFAHGQQQCSSGNSLVVLPCQGGGGCNAKGQEVLAAKPGGGKLEENFTIGSCGFSEGNQCEVVYMYANGPCLAAALDQPNILRNLDRLSRTSPIPILVASCNGGLVELPTSEQMHTIAPQPLNVDARVLKDSISL